MARRLRGVVSECRLCGVIPELVLVWQRFISEDLRDACLVRVARCARRCHRAHNLRGRGVEREKGAGREADRYVVLPQREILRT